MTRDLIQPISISMTQYAQLNKFTRLALTLLLAFSSAIHSRMTPARCSERRTKRKTTGRTNHVDINVGRKTNINRLNKFTIRRRYFRRVAHASKQTLHEYSNTGVIQIQIKRKMSFKLQCNLMSFRNENRTYLAKVRTKLIIWTSPK